MKRAWCSCAAMVFAATEISSGQCGDYKIIELGVPSGCTNVEVRAFGINNRGQIVGQVICADASPVSYAFVWFPVHNPFEHPELEIVLLGTSGGSNTDSGANDLNDRAYVVGWQGEGPTSPTEAVFWDLDNGNTDPTSVPPPDVSGAETVEAVGINDKATFQVVGWYVDDEAAARGFVWLNGDEDSVSLDPAPDEDAGEWLFSKAFAINNETNALIGGTSFGTIPAVSCESAGGDATYWLRNFAPHNGLELAQPGFEEGNGELGGGVMGVNDAGNLVGFGIECFDDLRRDRALYWKGRTSSPINLGQLIMDLSGDGDYSFANAVTNDDDPVTIVGMNSTDDFAVVWQTDVEDPDDEEDFCVLDLNDAIGTTDWSDLIEAADINNDGWIVGWGLYDGSNVRAFLLIPAPQECVGNTNGDNVVDVEDLINVFLDWGTDGSSHGGDVDGSGIVNVLDLIVVVLNWGLCPGETGTPPDSIATEIQNAGLSWADWEEFLETVDDENYQCWMGHYLNGECCPSCPTCPPDCPDDDPFGGH